MSLFIVFHTTLRMRRKLQPRPRGCNLSLSMRLLYAGRVRLLGGDVLRKEGTQGQSPLPARRRRRVAEGKGISAMGA